MPGRVQKHVGNGVAHLSWRPEHVEVIAVGQNPPAPPEHPIDSPSEARTEGLHSAPEGTAILRLYDEVPVVSLERVVGHPEVTRRFAEFCQRTLELLDQPDTSQGGDVAPHLDGHVSWEAYGELLAREVSNSGPRPRVPPSTFAPPPPVRLGAKYQI